MTYRRTDRPTSQWAGIKLFDKSLTSVLLFFIAPTQPPKNFTAFNRSSTIIRSMWRPVPECCQLGVIRGYNVTLTDLSNTSITITNTVPAVPELSTRFINLKKFHMYQLSITAFTSKGSGPSVSTTASTDQDGMLKIF